MLCCYKEEVSGHGRKKINGNLALNGKERRVIRIEANHEQDAQKLRVAAYCRVSSSSED